jgi:hypothetical protein
MYTVNIHWDKGLEAELVHMFICEIVFLFAPFRNTRHPHTVCILRRREEKKREHTHDFVSKRRFTRVCLVLFNVDGVVGV